MTIENEAAPAATDATAIAETPSAPVTTEQEPVAETNDAGPQDAELDAQLSAVFRKNNIPRDESGRFQSTKPAQEGEEAEAEVSPDQPPAEEVKAVEEPNIPPPQSWSDEDKSEWQTLTPKARDIILRREREAQVGLSRMGNELNGYKPIKQVVEQYRDVFERNGVSVDDGIGRLLEAERQLETNPEAAIATLAQAYGVDLRRFGQNAPAGNTPDGMLHQRIAQLEQQLRETSHWVAHQYRQETETREQSVNALIEKFASDKPEEWAELENDIAAEITGLNANIAAGLIADMTAEQKLERAYKRALQLNPDVQRRRQEAQRKAEQEKQVAEARKRAEDAKRAKAVNVVSQPASGKQVRSMDDDLRETFRRAQSR